MSGRAGRASAGALGLVAGVYVWLAFAYVPPGVYWSPDIGYKVIQAANVRGALDLSIEYPGQTLDPAFHFFPFHPGFYYLWKGRVYFAQPPVMAVLSRPFIFIWGAAGERVWPLAAGLISIALVGLLMRQLNAQPAWLGILLAGLATPIMMYSLFLWEHILAVALGLGAVYAWLKAASHWRWVLLSGLLAGFAGSIRKELLLLALILWAGLMWQRRWRSCVIWSAAGALPVLGWWGFAVLHSGNLVPPEFRISTSPALTPTAYLLRAGWEAFADFVFDPRYGRMGDGLMLALIAYGAARWVQRRWARDLIQSLALSAVLIGVCLAAPKTVFSSGGLFSLLSASPWMVLGWFSGTEEIPAARTMRPLTLVFATLVALSLGLLTEAGPYQPGLEWGARFALIVFPLSAPLAVQAVRHLAARAAHAWPARIHLALALAVVAVSAAIQLIGVSLVRNPAVTSEARAALLALPDDDVVTNEWWLSAAVPRLYLSKRLFLIRDEAGLRDWMRAAAAAGVRRFVFVSYDPLSESVALSLAPPGVRVQVVEVRALSNRMIITRVLLETK